MDLTRESSLIAKGTTHLKDGDCILEILKVMKGASTYTTLPIVQKYVGLAGPIPFTEGLEVLVFIEEVDEKRGVLMGDGEMGKWPKATFGGFPDFLVSASVTQMENALRKVQDLVTISDLETRVALCDTYLSSKDIFLQYIALDYILYSKVVTLAGEKESAELQKKGAQERRNMLRRLSKSAVKLTMSNNAYIESEAMRLLRYYAFIESVPLLIEHMSSPDRSVRNSAVVVLNTLLKELKEDKQIPIADIGDIGKMASQKTEIKKWWNDANLRHSKKQHLLAPVAFTQ